LINFEIIINFIVILFGLFFVLRSGGKDHKKRVSNRYLVIFIVINMVLIFRGMRWSIDVNLSNHRLFSFLDGFIFLYPVYLYAYIKQLTSSSDFHITKPHFILPIIYFLFSLVNISISPNHYLSNLSHSFLTHKVIETIAILSCFFYLVKTYLHFRKYISNEKKHISYIQNALVYIKVFLWVVLMFVLTWAITFFGHHLITMTGEQIVMFYTITHFALLGSICVVVYHEIAFPQLFRLEEQITPQRLSSKETETLKAKIDALMLHQKAYLEPQLNLAEFSKRLNASTNDISWFLNKVLKKTFYDFVNTYRVKEFIEKLEKGEHRTHTISTLSFDAGFNSKSTFNKAFKEFTNQTPREYIKKRGL